jgi:hypothetical protein
LEVTPEMVRISEIGAYVIRAWSSCASLPWLHLSQTTPAGRTTGELAAVSLVPEALRDHVFFAREMSGSRWRVP